MAVSCGKLTFHSDNLRSSFVDGELTGRNRFFSFSFAIVKEVGL